MYLIKSIKMNESPTNQLAGFQIQIEITWIFEYDIYIVNGQQTVLWMNSFNSKITFSQYQEMHRFLNCY